VADHLGRALSADGTVRGLAAVTTGLVEEARRRHGTLPTATAALGRGLTAALLLGGLLKTGERISLEVSGDGPLGCLLADATPDGGVRGFVSRPKTELPARGGKLDVGGAVGRGILCVMRVPATPGPPYRSIVPLVSGEIGVDVARYLVDSEQTPSVVGVGVWVEPDGRVGAAGGYLLQAMPGASDRAIDALEANVAAAPTPSELVREGLDASGMLARLMHGLAPRDLERRPVAYRCRCTRGRALGACVAMGREELCSVLESDRRAEVVCEFCGERYEIGEDELRGILGEVSPGSEP
jgi:molecular chaperone Hsp33